MYPWLWFWAPQFHFPFSGSVAQRIEPDTSWFFAGIRPEAGNGDVEQQIFDVASYGRQLGLVTEVLLAQTAKDTVPAKQAARSLARLKDVYQEIEAVKQRNRDKLTRSAVAALEHGRRFLGGDLLCRKEDGKPWVNVAAEVAFARWGGME